MNGYDFIKEVLAKTDGDIEPLLLISEYKETQWLEFKAIICPEQSKLEIGYNKDDYKWNVAKSLYAMINSIGGAVIIGIAENENDLTNPVSHADLSISGFKGDKDGFTRDVTHGLLRKSKYSTQKGQYKIPKDYGHYFEPLWGSYEGKDVLILLVKPIEQDSKEFLSVNKVDKNNQASICYFARESGDRGIVVDYKTLPNFSEYWQQRDINGSKKLFTEVIKRIPKNLIPTVKSYLTKLLKEVAEESKYFTNMNGTLSNSSSCKTNLSKKQNVESDDWLRTESRVSKKEKSVLDGDVLTLLKQENRVVITGEPGAGKTSCLLKFSHDLAQSWTPRNRWPLYIQLSEFSTNGFKSLILSQLHDVEWHHLESEIEKEHIVFVFDALNECPAQLYEQCFEELSKFIKDYPKANIVMSTRNSHYPDQLPISKLKLRSLDHNQQINFISSRLMGMPHQTEELLAEIESLPSASLISRSPILLRIMCFLKQEQYEIPKGMATLYKGFFERWYQREKQKDIKNGTIVSFEFHELIKILSFLAFKMRVNGITSCNLQFIISLFKDKYDESDIESIFYRYGQGLVLSYDPKNDRFRFAHETFLEYLTAEYLITIDSFHFDKTSQKFGALSWSMPIVFAFELMEYPSEQFLENAWNIEPLLVSAAHRSSDQLNLLPIPKNDAWLSGVLEVMRGNDVAHETNKIGYAARLPPKYQIEPSLTNTLASMPFWYSLNSHPEGERRARNLIELITERESVWIELLHAVYSGFPKISEQLYPAQKLILNHSNEEFDVKQALETASISELCHLKRKRKISEGEFKKHWAKSLAKSNPENIDIDLIMLLRTESFDAKQLLAIYKDKLKAISENERLSLKVLNKLINLRGVVERTKFRTPDRLSKLIQDSSALNFKKLVKNGYIRKEDISAKRFASILSKVKNYKDYTFILDTKLFDAKDLPDAEKLIEQNNKPIYAPKIDIDSLVTRQNAELEYNNLSKEEKILSEIETSCKDVNKQKANHVFHNELSKQIIDAKSWPKDKALKLAEISEAFYSQYGSKNKRKIHRTILKELRDSFDNEQ